MLRLGKFFHIYVDNLILGLLNLWRVVRRLFFSEETLLKLLISKAVTAVVMSVTKRAFPFHLSVFCWAMFTLTGTASPKMWNLV